MSDVEEGAEGEGEKKKGKEKKKKEDDKPAKEEKEEKKKEKKEEKAEEESEDSFSRYDPEINILLSHLTRANHRFGNGQKVDFGNGKKSLS